MSTKPHSSQPGQTEQASAELRASDRAEFGLLYGRYRGALLGLCTRRLSDRELAKDVMQEAFTRAYHHFDRFDRTRPFWPWIATIAERLCIDILKRTPHESALPPSERADLPLEFAWQLGLRSSDDTVEQVLAGERRRLLEKGLASLPPRQRRALLLYALEGWRYSDIAAAEGVSVGAVKLLLVRAREKLRRTWESGALGLFGTLGALRRKLGRPFVHLGSHAQTVGADQWVAGLSAGVLAVALSLATLEIPHRADAVVPRVDPDGEVGSLTKGSLVGVEASDSGRYSEGGLRPSPAWRAEANVPSGSSGAASSYQPDEKPSSASGQDPAAYPEDEQVDHTPPGWESVPPSPAKDATEEVVDPAHDATPENTRISSIVVSPRYEEDRSIYASGYCGWWGPNCWVLFVSRDGGATWKRLSDRSFSGHTVLVPENYRSSNQMFAVGGLGLQESLDGGRSWGTVGLVGARGSDGAAISPSFGSGDPRILIANWDTRQLFEYWADRKVTVPAKLLIDPANWVTSVTFRRLATGGVTTLLGGGRFDPLTLATYSRVYGCGGQACLEGTLPARAEGILAPREMTGSDSVVMAFNIWYLYRSVDGGKTFASLPPPVRIPAYMMDLVAWSGAQRLNLAVAGRGDWGIPYGGVYLSKDAGQNWIRSVVGLPGFEEGVDRVAVTSSGRLLAAGSTSGISCSQDGGVTWTPRCSPER